MLSFDAVEVAIEETGVAVESKKNEGVSERLEEWFNRSFKCLVRLSIMVHDESLSLVSNGCSMWKTQLTTALTGSIFTRVSSKTLVKSAPSVLLI